LLTWSKKLMALVIAILLGGALDPGY
jgi:hypothetical protein